MPKATLITDKLSIIRKLESKRWLHLDHWIWLGSCDSRGYGNITINSTVYKVHRISAYIYKNLDLNNTDIFALHNINCTRKDCFNPEHLHCGNKKDNRADLSFIQLSTPNYPCGHPRTAENSRLSGNGGLFCRTCNNIKSLAAYRKRNGMQTATETIDKFEASELDALMPGKDF